MQHLLSSFFTRLGISFLLGLFLFLSCGVEARHARAREKKESTTNVGLLRKPPMPEPCAKLPESNILNMLVIGDSVMWGQGLPEDKKSSYLVQDWLCRTTQRQVTVWREAHSGATLESKDDVCPDLHGEINASRPTIPEQIRFAAAHYLDQKPEVILMNGCANDFNFRKFVNPDMQEKQIERWAKEVCHDRMVRALEELTSQFPAAAVVVTGYYPIVTKDSAKNAIWRYLAGREFSTEDHPWIFTGTKVELFERQRNVSQWWHQYSNSALRDAVNRVNNTKGGRIRFAQIEFGDGDGFAAPKKSSLLWTIKFNATGKKSLSKAFYVLFGLRNHMFEPNDKTYEDRKEVCKTSPTCAEFDRSVCTRAGLGHPNEMGARKYYEAIRIQLCSLLSVTPLAITGC